MAHLKPTKLVKYPDFLERKQHYFPSANSDELKVFKVLLYVRQFHPEEISVKVIGSHLIIHGRHEDHVDLHGFVSREFQWKYPIPDVYDPRSASTSLLPGGVLKIFVYRKDLWARFLSEDRPFVQYIDMRSFVFQNFNYKVDGRKIVLKAAVKAEENSKMKDFQVKEEYPLPSDIDPDTVTARLSHIQMLEVRGSRLPSIENRKTV